MGNTLMQECALQATHATIGGDVWHEQHYLFSLWIIETIDVFALGMLLLHLSAMAVAQVVKAAGHLHWQTATLCQLLGAVLEGFHPRALYPLIRGQLAGLYS